MLDAPYYVYMILLGDGRIYTGHTNDPPRRTGEHDQGKGCRTTGVFGHGEVIFLESHPDRASAMKREKQIKGWSRAKKLALAEDNMEELKRLARRRKR